MYVTFDEKSSFGDLHRKAVSARVLLSDLDAKFLRIHQKRQQSTMFKRNNYIDYGNSLRGDLLDYKKECDDFIDMVSYYNANLISQFSIPLEAIRRLNETYETKIKYIDKEVDRIWNSL